jgi:hypothetical protein
LEHSKLVVGGVVIPVTPKIASWGKAIIDMNCPGPSNYAFGCLGAYRDNKIILREVKALKDKGHKIWDPFVTTAQEWDLVEPTHSDIPRLAEGSTTLIPDTRIPSSVREKLA